MRRLVLELVVFLSITIPAAAQNPANARDSVAAAMRAYMQAVRDNNRAGVVAKWADDGVEMSLGNRTASGRAALDSLFGRTFAAVRVMDIVEHTDEILVESALAVQRGTFALTVQPATGPAQTARARYLVVWRRQASGEWKIARAMSTDLPER